MSNVGVVFNTGIIALSASNTRGALAKITAAANHRALLTRLRCSISGITATDPPILVEMRRGQTGGSDSTDIHKKEDDGDDETLQTNVSLYTGNPADDGDKLAAWYLNENGGGFSEESLAPALAVIKGGGTIVFTYTSGAITSAANLVLSGRLEE